jgi:mono/diheme cytochrome c family protein
VNPTNPAATLAAGDSLFHIYCAVCHGPTGAADGPVTPKIGAPSLLTPKARGWSDGHIYSLIRYGRGVMPRYGDKIVLPDERWAVVNYVRKLQADQPLPVAAPGGTK